MTPDQLIQNMRLTNLNLIRTRLMTLEGKDPQGYAVVVKLFEPPKENRKKP